MLGWSSNLMIWSSRFLYLLSCNTFLIATVSPVSMHFACYSSCITSNQPVRHCHLGNCGFHKLLFQLCVTALTFNRMFTTNSVVSEPNQHQNRRRQVHNVKSRLPGIQSQKIQFQPLALPHSLLSATIKIFILWQLSCEAIYGDNTQKKDTYVSSQVLRTSPHSWFKSNQIRQRWDDHKVTEIADLPPYYWAGGGNPTSKNRGGKTNIKTITTIMYARTTMFMRW